MGADSQGSDSGRRKGDGVCMKLTIDVSRCDNNIFFLVAKVRSTLEQLKRDDDIKSLEKAIEAIQKTKGIDHRAAIVEAVKAVVQLEGWE